MQAPRRRPGNAPETLRRRGLENEHFQGTLRQVDCISQALSYFGKENTPSLLSRQGEQRGEQSGCQYSTRFRVQAGLSTVKNSDPSLPEDPRKLKSRIGARYAVTRSRPVCAEILFRPQLRLTSG